MYISIARQMKRDNKITFVFVSYCFCMWMLVNIETFPATYYSSYTNEQEPVHQLGSKKKKNSPLP